MKVKFVAEGRTVYEITAYSDGMVQKIKIRDCNTEESARAVANYCTVRKM